MAATQCAMLAASGGLMVRGPHNSELGGGHAVQIAHVSIVCSHNVTRRWGHCLLPVLAAEMSSIGTCIAS